MDGGEEIDRQSVIPGRNAPQVLEAAEHAFNGVPILVKHGRKTVFPTPVGLGRDVWHDAPGLDLATNGVGIVAGWSRDEVARVALEGRWIFRPRVTDGLVWRSLSHVLAERTGFRAKKSDEDGDYINFVYTAL